MLEKEADVRQIDRTDRERPEMHGKRQVDHQSVERARQQPAEIVDDPQHEKHAERDQSGDDLVGGQRRGQKPGADQGGAEQQQAEITTIDRAKIRIAEQPEHHGVRRRQQQHQRDQAHGGDEFRQHDLEFRHRRGEQYFQRAELALLGDQPHGDQRRGQHEQHEHLKEDVHQARLMADKQGQREAVAHDQEEHRHHRVGDRRGEQRRFLLEQENPKASHAASLTGRRVRSRNTRSRSGGISASSETAMPWPTSMAAISAASEGRGSASIR